jgi:hypothetical protein
LCIAGRLGNGRRLFRFVFLKFLHASMPQQTGFEHQPAGQLGRLKKIKILIQKKLL